MTDEIRIYHVDDPNDAPDRRLGAFPTINPFLPTSLPQYVIEPVAQSLYTAMQYWYQQAYFQGFAHQQQQQQQQQQHLRLQQLHQQGHHPLQQTTTTANLQTLQPPAPTQPTAPTSLTSPDISSTSSSTSKPAPQSSTSSSTSYSQHHQLHRHQNYQQQAQHLASSQPNDSPQPLSTASTAQMASSSSSSSSASSSSSSSSASMHSNSPQSTHYDHDHTNHNHNNHHHHHRSNSVSSVEQEQQQQQQRKHQHEHIKKPLNPFMIFMQKQRPEIVRQGIIKESAAINQLLGQQWRKLSREEQEPYYKLAEQEKLIHAQKYPGWSARDNYANQKKRKKLKLKSISLNGLDQSDKKCRARFGLSNMVSWCKPCKRKKKCIYSMPRHQHSNNTMSVNSIAEHGHHLNHHAHLYHAHPYLCSSRL